ncbi:MAG: M15 family metallopeptidase [Bacteroidales bacterium]|jgi:hypothetical protein|nr:M15 family metallopeptidase [Bacteroidales bacterium]
MGNLLHTEKMKGVDDRLKSVVNAAVAMYEHDVNCTEGVRTLAKQNAYYAQGRKPLEAVNQLRKQAGIAPITSAQNKAVTWTMKSKHLEGKAVDLVPQIDGKVRYDLCREFAPCMIKVSKELNIPIRWGADWNGNGVAYEKGETDSPHFELD